MILAGSAFAQGGEGEVKKSATIWFLDHSGFAVRTAKEFLVFDCVTDQPAAGGAKGLDAGVIDTAAVRDFDPVIFVSHGHGDHLNPALLRKWRKELQTATFVMPKGLARDVPGLADDLGMSLVEASEGRELRIGKISVFSIAATDEGLAYLVKADGISIFHAGDHALWASQLREEYQAGISKIKERGPVDIAFLPLNPTHPNLADILEGAVWAADMLKPAAVVPMHLSGRLEEGSKLARQLPERNVNVPCVVPASRGQRFEYDGKTLKAAAKELDAAAWKELLKNACKADEAFISQIKESAGDSWEGSGFDEEWWNQKGNVTEAAAGDSAAVLAGQYRFYFLHGGVFGMLSMPTTILTVGISEKGKAFLIDVTTRRWEGVSALAAVLKPAKTGPEAISAASLAARLLVYCKRCNWKDMNVRVDASKCVVAGSADGGFEVGIPAGASASESKESAKVFFDKDGRLKNIEFKRCMHR